MIVYQPTVEARIVWRSGGAFSFSPVIPSWARAITRMRSRPRSTSSTAPTSTTSEALASTSSFISRSLSCGARPLYVEVHGECGLALSASRSVQQHDDDLVLVLLSASPWTKVGQQSEDHGSIGRDVDAVLSIPGGVGAAWRTLAR